MNMRDLLVTLIVFAALPVAFLSPFTGIASWSLLSVMNPPRLHLYKRRELASRSQSRRK
jgi:hypothetical protein